MFGVDLNPTGLRRRGFTLIELLVVISIIGILAGLTLPAIQVARDTARRMQCSNNLKQIGVAMLNYENANKGLPPRRNWTPPGRPHCGWGVIILPYIENMGVYRMYDFKSNFYDAVNNAAIAMPMQIYCCPSAPQGRMVTVVKDGVTATGAAGDYFGPNSVRANWIADPTVRAQVSSNQNTAMIDDKVRPIKEITDGASHTLLISEQAGRPDWYVKRVRQPDNSGLSSAQWWGPWASYNVHSYWTYSEDGITPDGPCTINCNNSQGVYSFHRYGANGVFADGSVHFLSETISPQTLTAIVTRASHDYVSGDEL